MAPGYALSTPRRNHDTSQEIERPVESVDIVAQARAEAIRRVRELGRADLVDDAALVVSELVTNALLHAQGCTGVDVAASAAGVRIEVRDGSRIPPVVGRSSEGSLTGRGLRMVEVVAARWGAEAEPDGKVVWAEVAAGDSGVSPVSGSDLPRPWADEWDWGPEPRFHVELGEVPTDLLLAAKSHVDNVVREFALASAGAEAGLTAALPLPLAALLRSVVEGFAEARVAIKHQALEAARLGQPTTRLALDLPASAIDFAWEYARALDAVDDYSRARRLLTLESPPQHRAFRRWYIGEVIAQLRAAAAGEPPPPAQRFERLLLAELDRLAAAQRTSERAARLYAVAAALATAATPEEVAEAVVNEGTAALGASGGGLLLTATPNRLALPGAVGYDEDVVARLRTESPDAELPAAVVMRTGVPVWLESKDDCDRRFPDLADVEHSTLALCAVPLEVRGRRLGALRFSFTEARLFDDDERRFVLALAALAAQALARAQLERSRVDVSRRLQKGLLPPRLPGVPGIEVAAVYHSFGDGIEVGGDFYDVWPIGPSCWALAIGDASGTGPEAAALTTVVRHTLRALTMTEVDPAIVVARLNAALVAATDDSDDRFCTAIYGALDVSEGFVLRVGGGGHPPLIVQRAGGGIETVTAGGSLLGVFADIEVGTAVIALNPGDTILLLTDGVLEARRDGVMFDMDGVRRVLSGGHRGASAIARSLQAAVLEHTDGVLTDDMAAIVIHVP